MRVFTFFISSLIGFILTALGFLWFAAGEIYDYEDTFDLERDARTVDVVVVLAGGKGRIPVAVELWKEIREQKKGRTEPVLFLSGLGTDANIQTLKEQGVPNETLALFNPENVVFENVSENTFENAQVFASFVRQKKWRHVVLVTAGYHMRRAIFILDRALGDEIELSTHTVDSVRFGRNEWHKDLYAIRVTLIEYIKWLYYRQSY